MDAVSVIIPASNEAALIGPCLDSLLASDGPDGVQVIVVANGCIDDTAMRARAKVAAFETRGWRLTVIERKQGGKPAALNAGDGVADGAIRVYLDADVTVSPALLAVLTQTLDAPQPAYASGKVQIAATGLVSCGYARIWQQLPFMADCVPGCGLFAVNAAGRARWGAFPQIISDDTFVRLQFSANERLAVAPAYRWPVVEGLGNLIRVRRRQDAGVDEIAATYPDLLANDDDRPVSTRRMLAIALSAPFGFAIYCTVALASRLTRGRASGWSRGR